VDPNVLPIDLFNPLGMLLSAGIPERERLISDIPISFDLDLVASLICIPLSSGLSLPRVEAPKDSNSKS